MASPYAGLNTDAALRACTNALLAAHPLRTEQLKAAALAAWAILWRTRIGDGATAFKLDEIDVPATVIGYFFEKLLARELHSRFPGLWRGGQSKDEKDLIYLPDTAYSIEVKTSGQLGSKIFGNRSYGQKSISASLVTKAEKSGYYFTVNFYEQTLTLLRFGWIDADDWKPQKSATGQAASLGDYVYRSKLVGIAGDYRLQAPVALLPGVGAKVVAVMAQEGITTISDLLDYSGNERQLHKFREQAKALGY